jgi:amidohydrolase
MTSHLDPNPATADLPPVEACGRAFDNLAETLAAEVVRIRRHLHAHPEPSGEEIATTQFVQQQLAAHGISGQTGRSNFGRDVGLWFDLDLGEPPADAPRIALRCDLDALKMLDEKRVEYRSTRVGVAHACGHDAHTAIVLGIALTALRMHNWRWPRELPGLKLRFLFQPAEEASNGARWLVEQGAIERVDAILGVHVDPERQVGEVGIRYGMLTANCDAIDIALRGHGGHAARPHHSRDPIAAAAQLVTSLYQLLPRSVDARDASVFTVGRIHGGYSHNVIPEVVAIQATLRTTDAASRQTLQQRIREICQGVALASGVEIEIALGIPLPGVNNHPRLAAALEAAAVRVVSASGVQRIKRASLGGEDFAVYLDHVNGAMFRLGCAALQTAAPYLHSPLFDIDERCLAIGMKVLFRAAVLLSLPAESLPRHESQRP